MRTMRPSVIDEGAPRQSKIREGRDPAKEASHGNSSAARDGNFRFVALVAMR